MCSPPISEAYAKWLEEFQGKYVEVSDLNNRLSFSYALQLFGRAFTERYPRAGAFLPSTTKVFSTLAVFFRGGEQVGNESIAAFVLI